MIWTIVFPMKNQMRDIFDKEKDGLQRVPPAKLLLNFVFKALSAQKKRKFTNLR